ncbi:MAG: choice-of-anchor L domain-containing protein [Sphingobacteriales bacterium]|nr:MAG: choice-of-anchor L domain-containing protein [Sphingobacteriales bacterium]
MNKTSTRHIWLSVFCFICLSFLNIESNAQCSFSANVGAVSLGSITPTGTWQTTGCVTGGDYYTFNATVGQQFAFTFCGSGGTASWDTELSINTAAGAGVAGAYNDDFCGIQSQLTWTATSNGTFAIYVTGFGCTNNANCATLAYRVITPPPPPTALTVQTGGNNSNASWLVQNVFLTGCSQVSGVTFTGNNQAIGHFINGASIGIPEGIIIASGAATNAQGPNNSTGVTSAFGTPGDANLTALTASTPCGSPAPTFDAAFIQFSFVPLTNSVQFQYVFASDEYPEYVCSSFNDVFGFFISGPGVPLQNIALVPGTSTYVGINTVNPTNNSAFYNANPAGSIITQYDGYTDVMTAVATGLTPCQTYTIKLAVADAGDSILDSAVFLAANSFNAGNAVSVTSFVPSSGTQDAYEGCQDGYFEFVRGDVTDLSQPIVLQISVTGTATPGADYQTLPITVTIPAGQISYQLPVIAYADLLPEGFESIIVQINELQCNCTFPPPAQLNIYDSPEPFNAFISDPPTICPGENALIAVIASGSTFTPYTYVWSNGQNGPAVTVTPPVSTSYSVTVTDACGRTTTATIQVNVSNAPPNAAINPAGPFCSNASPVTLTAVSAGGTWSGPGVNPVTGEFDPVAAFGTGPGPYTITYTVSNSCGSSTQNTTITVNPVAVPSINPVTPVCQGAVATTTLTSNVPGGTWSGPGILGGTNTSGQFSYALAASLGASPYTVTYTTPAPCGSSTTTTISVLAQATAGISPASTICNGQSATITATGGGTYQWSSGLGTNATITISPTTNTTYTVTVTNTDGCTATANTTVTVNNINPPSLAAPSICPGQNVSLNAGPGYTQYLWSTGGATQTITVNPSVNTSYTVTVTNAAGCTASASVNVTISSNIVPPNPLPQTICSGSSVTLNAGLGYASYSWSSGGSGQTVSVSPTTTTTYTVTVSNVQGCTATGSVTVTVNSITPPTIAPQQLCQGGSPVDLTVNGGPYASYAWSNGGTSQTISVNPSATTTYIVTVTNAATCTTTASVTVTVNTISPPAVTSASTCLGGSATISAPPLFANYLWSDGSTSQSITVSPVTGTSYSVTVTDANGCTAVGTGTVSVNNNPAPAISGSLSFCIGSNTTLSAPPGFSTYAWSPSGSTSSITVNTPGTYTVTVTDANGCTGTASVNVTQEASLSPAISGDLTLCAGETSTLDVGAGFASYLWSTGSTTASITVPPGIYSVTVTDAGNCSGTTEVEVVANPAPEVSISGDPTVCAGDDSNLDADAGFVQYSWSTGAFGQSILVTTPGTYVVTVTDANGCTGTSNFVVTENNIIPPAITPQSTCAGVNAPPLDAGPGFNSYLWSTGATTQSIVAAPNATTTYNVTVTGAEGCSATTDATINVISQPQAVADPPQSICNGDMVFVGVTGNGDTYTWDNGDTGFVIAVSPSVTTVYTVTVSIGGVCSATDQTTVFVNPLPTPDAGPDQEICLGQESATLIATGGLIYSWDGFVGNNQSIVVSPTTTTTYTVTVTDANNCSATDDVTVTVNELTGLTITGAVPVCEGDPATLTASGGLTYYWSTGESTTSISVNPITTTSYTVTATDANGCSAEVTETVVVNAIPLAIPGSNIPCEGTDLQLSGDVFVPGGVPPGSTVVYSWTGPGGFTSSNQFPLIPGVNIAQEGVYTLVVTVNGCPSASADVNIDVLPSPVAVATNNGPACAGDIQLQGSTSLSGTTVSYQWTGPGGYSSILQNPILSGGSALSGTYTLVVTVDACPSAPVTTDVDIFPIPPLTISGNPIFCEGASAVITVDESYPTYLWSNGSTTQSTTVTTGGVYFVTVTDATGCTAAQSINITVNPLPTPAITGGGVTVCAGSPVLLSSTGGFSAYQWSNGMNTKDITVNPEFNTIYTVTVTDANGCTGTATTNVDAIPSPDITITAPPSICLGNSATITVNGDPAHDYLWSNGNTSQSFTVSPASTTTYTVTATNSIGCTRTASVEIVVDFTLSPSITGALVVCPGFSTTLNPGAYAAYAWSTGSTNQTITVFPTGPTTYTVTVTDANGCTGANSVLVQLNVAPTPVIDGVIGCGNFVELTAPAGFDEYIWNNSATTQIINPTIAGTYQVTVTDSNGCTGESNTYPVTFQPDPSISVLSTTDATCGNNNGGMSVTGTGGTAPLTYSWSQPGGPTGPSATNLGEGTYSVTVTDANGCSATTSADIVNIAGPTIDSMLPDDATCGLNNGTIDVSISGGTAPVNYLWSHNALLNSPNATGLGTNSYTVTITDANNCTDVETVSITNLAGPTLAPGAVVNAACGVANGSVSVILSGGTSPITYSWSHNPGLNSPDAINLLSGSYTVTATDANGCQAIQPMAVANDGAPTLAVDSVSPATCGNNNGSITVSATGGFGTLSYEWSHDPTLTGPTAFDLAPGNYFVTVTDENTCEAVQVVIVSNLLSPVLQVTGVLPDNCGAGTGSITISTAGGTAPINYLWSHDGTLNSPTANGLSAATYTVTVTDATGCTASISAPVVATTNPTLAVTTENPASCSQSNGSGAVAAAGGTGPYSFEWSHDPTLNSNAATDLATGTYDVTVTDANGCIAVTTVNISTLNAAVLNLVSTANATCGNDNGSITISATGGNGTLTYSWSHAPLLNNTTATDLPAGSYTVTATDATGCVSTLDISISADPLPTISISGVNQTTCGDDNGSILVTGSGGTGTLTYSWSHDNSLNSDSAVDLPAGSYTISVTDSNGCLATTNTTINSSESPVVSVSSTTNATCGNANGSITFATTGGTGAITYAWSSPGATGPSASGLPDGTYTVTVTDANGCTDTESATITNSTPPTIAVDNISDATCGVNNGSITVIASGGTGALNYTWSQAGLPNSPTVTGLAAGSYTVTVTDANGCTNSTNAVIANPDGPVVSVGSTSDATCGLANGSITFTTTGGTGILSYNWSQAGIPDSPTGTGLAAGTYTVTVTDELGCLDIQSATIGDSPLPTVSQDVITPASCGQSDGSISVIASGGTAGYSYSWSHNNGLNSSIATDLAIGSYTVTVTDANGCTGSVTLDVGTLNGPDVALSTLVNATCTNDNGSVTVTTSGGTGIISYTWSHDSTLTGTTATGLASGTYIVTVSDENGCQDVLTTTVNFFGSPTVSLSSIGSACGLTDGSATATVAGGTAPLTYTWAHDGTLNAAVATGLAPGDYAVTVTDNNGCVSNATVTVPGNMPPPAPICGTVTNTTLQFVWDPIPGATGYEISIDGGTPETLTAGTTSYTATGLSQNTTITITIFALGPVECGNSITVSQDCTTTNVACPTITPEIIGLSASYCVDANSVVLSGTPAGGIFSGTGITGTTFDPVSAGVGTHTVTYEFTDPDGCYYITTLPVTVVDLPVALFTAPEVICLGDQATFNFTGTASPSSTYSWNFGSAGNQTGAGPHNITWNSPGTYTATLTVSTPEGCSSDYSLQVGVSNVNVTATTPIGYINSGTSATLTGTATSALSGQLTYTWTASSGTLSCTDCPITIATPVDDLTTYTFTAVDEYGCEATASVQLGLIYQKLVTIPNAFSPNGDNTNDIFRLTGLNVESVNLYIYDRWGGQMFQMIGEDIEKGWDGTFKGKNAELGVYVYYAEVTFTDGTSEFFKGNVTLIH